MASKPQTSKSSIENHLLELHYVGCFDVWLPQKLSEKTIGPYLSYSVFKQIVIATEKWIPYNK